LRVPVEIVGFTTDNHSTKCRAVRHYPFKEFRERIASSQIAARMLWCKGSHDLGDLLKGNADGDSVMLAASRLAPRKEGRKVLIVLSDGDPTEAGNSDADATLRAAISASRKAGVEVHGIGICTHAVTRFYGPGSPVIRDPAGLPAALVQTLKTVLDRPS
jgi:cobalamin biosynthesis protein CobT